MRHSIERPRTRKDSRTAELADQLGNKLFGVPRLPAIASTADISGLADLEAQAGPTQSTTADGVEMTQIRRPSGPNLASTGKVADMDNDRRTSLAQNRGSPLSPTVHLMTFVRMPIPEQSRDLVGRGTWHMTSEEDQEKAVQSEWAGVELGITEMEVVGEGVTGGDGVWGGHV